MINMAIDFTKILDYAYSLNSKGDYFFALGIFIGLIILFKIFNVYILSILKRVSRKTKISFDDLIFDFVGEISGSFYIYLSLYIALRFLKLSEIVNKILWYILIIFIAYYFSKGLVKVTNHLFDIHLKKRRKDNNLEGESMINVLKLIVKILIWVLVFLLVISNFGINITPVVASLGIGGIAIALALQNILGDLFSAFAIYFDKPFKEGDFIIVGEDMGVVKNIGVKTTRIQALGGQEIVITNSELTNTRINNYKRMQKRRIAFKFGVEYSTSAKKLKKIKNIVSEVIGEMKNLNLDRVHFKEFGDSSLIYEVVYYIDTNDYNSYMDAQEKINLNIKEKFEEEKIFMAFPTQTIHIKK